MADPSAIIRLDGSHGEGGGALLRAALAMSALTQQGLRIENIRANQRFPGLDAEDLTLLKALETISQADMVGAELGSTTLTFLPTQRARNLNGVIESVRNEAGRGPNALITLSALLPVLTTTGAYSTVSASGETYGFNALSYDYFANVTVEALKRVGLFARPELILPGFGRESAGEVTLDVEPSQLEGLNWTERGRLKRVEAIVSTAGMANVMGERAISHLKNMANHAGIPMEAEHICLPGRAPGSYITIWAEYEHGLGGGTAMGSRGVKAETLAHSAFEQFTQWMSTSGAVDEFLADQLLLPLVLARGSSSVTVSRLTDRLLTSIWVVKQFTPIRITVKGQVGSTGTILVSQI